VLSRCVDRIIPSILRRNARIKEFVGRGSLRGGGNYEFSPHFYPKSDKLLGNVFIAAIAGPADPGLLVAELRQLPPIARVLARLQRVLSDPVFVPGWCGGSDPDRCRAHDSCDPDQQFRVVRPRRAEPDDRGRRGRVGFREIYRLVAVMATDAVVASRLVVYGRDGRNDVAGVRRVCVRRGNTGGPAGRGFRGGLHRGAVARHRTPGDQSASAGLGRALSTARR